MKKELEELKKELEKIKNGRKRSFVLKKKKTLE